MMLVMLLPIVVRNLFPIIHEWVTKILQWKPKSDELIYERSVGVGVGLVGCAGFCVGVNDEGACVGG
eukprot:364757-Chlamydomonas_euryale.AAC.14